MNRASILRQTLTPLACLLATALTGCPNSDTRTDAALDGAPADASEAGADAAESGPAPCEMNLPRCDFPDGGAPA